MLSLPLMKELSEETGEISGRTKLMFPGLLTCCVIQSSRQGSRVRHPENIPDLHDWLV